MSPFIFDGIIILILALSVIIAALRGFIKEVLSVVGIAGAVVGAYALGPFAEPWCKKWLGVKEGAKEVEKIWGVVPADLMAMIIAYGGIFVVCFIVLLIFSHFVSGLVKEAGLGSVDRSLGVLFGLFRGGVLIVLAYLPFSLLMEADEFPDWIKKSYSAPVIERAVVLTSDVFDFEKNKGKDKKSDKKESGYDKIDRMEMDRLIDKGGK